VNVKVVRQARSSPVGGKDIIAILNSILSATQTSSPPSTRHSRQTPRRPFTHQTRKHGEYCQASPFTTILMYPRARERRQPSRKARRRCAFFVATCAFLSNPHSRRRSSLRPSSVSSATTKTQLHAQSTRNPESATCIAKSAGRHSRRTSTVRKHGRNSLASMS
jgi:hypothetical protein